MDGEESAKGWTTANLLKLVDRIRSNTPEMEKMASCEIGVLSVNWDKTAFPPYSAKECHDKWEQVMEKMRTLRSLTDLIAEAEEMVSKPLLLPKMTRKVFPRTDCLQNHIRSLQRKHPETMSETVVIAHKMCDELSNEMEDEYERKLALRRVEHRRNEDNNLPSPLKSKRSKLSAVTDAGLPMKPPRNGLSLFMKENPAESGPLLDSKLITTRKRWIKLSAAERQEYCTRCLKMKHEYNAKLREYLDRFDETEKQRIIKEQDIKFMKTKPLRTSRREPRMPKQTPLTYFAKDQRMSPDKSKKLWCQLPAKEKERYKEQACSNMKQYSENLQKWFKNLTPEKQRKYLEKKPSKLQFLNAKQKQVYNGEELRLSQPSDSEDEDITDISSEDDIWSSYEDESGEDWNMFERHR